MQRVGPGLFVAATFNTDQSVACERASSRSAQHSDAPRDWSHHLAGVVCPLHELAGQ